MFLDASSNSAMSARRLVESDISYLKPALLNDILWTEDFLCLYKLVVAVMIMWRRLSIVGLAYN